MLHVASSYGYPQMVKSLLGFKANADCRDEVCSCLCAHCIVQLFSECRSSMDDSHASGPCVFSLLLCNAEIPLEVMY